MLQRSATSAFAALSDVLKYAGPISPFFGILCFVGMLFERARRRRQILASVAIAVSGAFFATYQPAGLPERAGKVLLISFLFVATSWWACGIYHRWQAKAGSLPKQAAGTFGALADSARQLVDESSDPGAVVRVTSATATGTATFEYKRRPRDEAGGVLADRDEEKY